MMRINLKTWVYVFCLAASMAAPAPETYLALDIIDLAAISRMTPQQLEVLAEGLAAQEIMRTKRSSAQAIASVASKASSGLQGKLSLLGQASAGASSFIAAASSKTGGGDEHGYSYEPHEDTKVDFWGLKKSILNTLFQAVKAITGGVTILKGQLIKGSGALATSLGKVIKVKGEAVSNIGKKIVTSAALSPPKKHHGSSHAPVYGPPPVVHAEYPPSAYGVPSAPAHYSGPSAPTGYSAHKYPAHLDGHNKGKLNGVHAGFIVLTPVGEGDHHESHHSASEHAHIPLEPPQSFLHSAFSAIKSVFSSVAPSSAYEHSPSNYVHATEEHEIIDHPPPPLPQSFPSFKPMTWGAVNSYGDPAIPDAYSDYDPRHPRAPYDFHATKKTSGPKRLSQEKLQKITHNINKVLKMTQNIGRSSEELPKFDGLDVYRQMLLKGMKIPLNPTPVVKDDIGELSAELQPSPDPSTTTSTTTTTTTPNPVILTTTENTRRKKDVKFILRGNRIVQV